MLYVLIGSTALRDNYELVCERVYSWLLWDFLRFCDEIVILQVQPTTTPLGLLFAEFERPQTNEGWMRGIK